MKLKKLSWASILIKTNETTVLVDPLGGPIKGQDKPLAAKIGDPLEPLISLETIEQPDVILITHVHPDHFDHQAVLQHFGENVKIFVPMDSCDYVKKLGFRHVVGAQPNDEFETKDVKMIASYSVDGFGSPQVSWIIKDEKHTVIHSGDTQWHGYWWRMENQYGPIHAACLPVNGPILQVVGLKEQSQLPACLTPEEAVEATKLLGAKLIPIHYSTFNNPPYYSETENIEERLIKRANLRGVEVTFLKTNEQIIM
jgi:L-ascorbate metabolism protein UlaG (beta-lactamase superfamily)